MTKKILNDGAADYKIDSARSLVPITPNDDADLPDGPARGIWLNSTTAATIDYHEEDGTERTGLMLFPGANMLVVSRVLESSDATDIRAIY